MGVFVVRRLIGLVVVLFAISVLTFLIFFATPGIDPTRAFAGRNPTPETIAAVRHQFGLDRSRPVQYLLMMKRLFISRDLISYGEAWYPWYMRRLAERPANVLFALRQLLP